MKANATYGGKIRKTARGWQADFTGRTGVASGESFPTKSDAEGWLALRKQGVVLRRRGRGGSWQIDMGVRNGNRLQFSKPSFAEARGWAEQKLVELQNLGVKALSLTDAQRIDAAEGLRVLDGMATLKMAAEFYRDHHAPVGGVRTVDQVVAEFLALKAEKGRRPATLRDYNFRLKAFTAEFGPRHVHTLTSFEIERWLSRYRGIRQANNLVVLKGLFKYAQRQKLIQIMPTDGIDRPSIEESDPEIFSVAQAKAVMLAAREHTPRLVPMLALGMFCGIRAAELGRLEWESVNLDRRIVEITGKVAKKRSRRIVPMSDNCAAWIMPYARASGMVSPPNITARRGYAKIVKAAGLDHWPSNGLRHSFASYHVALHQNPTLTAFVMGHRDGGDVLFQHYMTLTTRDHAEEFFGILPPDAGQPAIRVVEGPAPESKHEDVASASGRP